MGNFQTTRWSLVLAAREDHPDARDALDALCRAYHPAVLAFVRGWGYSRSDAEDLTQSFFARFLEKRVHAAADPARGRFRVFLRTALHNFVINAQGRAAAVRRRPPPGASGLDPDTLPTEADTDLPERAFERAWALLVVNRALQRLRREAKAAGKADLFARLQGFLLEPPGPDDYARVAREISTRPNTIAVATHRMRQRLHELVRVELADTVSDADEVDGEYETLLDSMRLRARPEPTA
jgi:RNA polymerase sigma-70 factor (ECF subfamily)